MRKIISICILCLASSGITSAAIPKFQYEFDPAQLVVKWEAYKTNEKLAVAGKFMKSETKAMRTKDASLEVLMKGVRTTVSLNSVDSGNPARDTNLKKAFFEKFVKAAAATAQGRILSVQAENEAETSGKLLMELRMNGVTHPVEMRYQVTERKSEKGKEPTLEWSAKGSFNFLQWGLDDALDALNKACGDLHKGKDGVSRTWPEVELTLTMPLKKIAIVKGGGLK